MSLEPHPLPAPALSHDTHAHIYAKRTHVYFQSRYILGVMNRDYFTYGVLAGIGASVLGGGLYWLTKRSRKVGLRV